MKQVIQSLKSGDITLADLPVPTISEGHSVVKTHVTLVSSGTERMLLEFGKSNLIKKALSQPEKVKLTVDKVKTDGFLATYEAVSSKLDQPISPGYCNVGTVIESKIQGINVGQRVVSNGPHAEFVSVPKNLQAKVPDNVSDEEASFTVLASIGLQGIRLAKPTIGETFVVFGLGLIGLLIVQLLRANGCQVIGIDLDPSRQKLAESFGAKVISADNEIDAAKQVIDCNSNQPVDGVLIAASTSNNELISQAAQMCRKRGRIILVGVTGLNLNRADFYEKEITFQVSCSYGPGRYDNLYENKGIDYPLPFVRWTEQRNFESVLKLMSDGYLDVKPLISHRYKIENAKDALELLTSKTESPLGILLQFSTSHELPKLERTISVGKQNVGDISNPRIVFLGAGNYASRVLIPAFKSAKATMHTIISLGGVTATHHGKKFGFQNVSSSYEEVLSDETTDAVVIATRHNDHAQQIILALEAGKHVFCEKPLCISSNELDDIRDACRNNPDRLLMVGFNRRFSPLVVKMKELITKIAKPKAVIITVNAGYLPGDHWINDPNIGGGRIVGEACHFIDLACHLINEEILSYDVNASPFGTDAVTINISFSGGSIASIHYLCNGDKAFPKERVEVFVSGKILRIENFKKLLGWGWRDFKKDSLWKQDKGQNACAASFVNSLKGDHGAPIPLNEILDITQLSIDVAKVVRTKFC